MRHCVRVSVNTSSTTHGAIFVYTTHQTYTACYVHAHPQTRIRGKFLSKREQRVQHTACTRPSDIVPSDKTATAYAAESTCVHNFSSSPITRMSHTHTHKHTCGEQMRFYCNPRVCAPCVHAERNIRQRQWFASDYHYLAVIRCDIMCTLARRCLRVGCRCIVVWLCVCLYVCVVATHITTVGWRI